MELDGPGSILAGQFNLDVQGNTPLEYQHPIRVVNLFWTDRDWDTTNCTNSSGPAYAFGVQTSTFQSTATDRASNTGQAAAAEAAGNTNSKSNAVDAFVNEVNAVRGRKISDGDADILVYLGGFL